MPPNRPDGSGCTRASPEKRPRRPMQWPILRRHLGYLAAMGALGFSFFNALFYAAAIFPADAVVVKGEVAVYQGRCFCPRCGSSVFARSGDEIELHLGAMDAPDRFAPEYECWTERREAWLPAFPDTHRHERDRGPE